MANYSIKQLSALSGIKSHTIRIWERRYGLFSPSRTDTNIRRYGEADLKLALSITHLQAMGYRISQIASLSTEQIAQLVGKTNSTLSTEPAIGLLLQATVSLEPSIFSNITNPSIAEKGFEATYENLLVPFLQRLGQLWLSGAISPAHEHFATNTIVQIIISHTQTLPIPSSLAPKMLFFLPENEFHEVGLLYSAFKARQAGFAPIYLGRSVPLKDVIAVCSSRSIGTVLTYLTKPISPDDFALLFDKILHELPNATILASGQQVEANSSILPKKIKHIQNTHQLELLLKKLSEKQL